MAMAFFSLYTANQVIVWPPFKLGEPILLGDLPGIYALYCREVLLLPV